MPSRAGRILRIVYALLLGAVRVCCRLFGCPRLEPERPIRLLAACSGAVPYRGETVLTGLEERGPPPLPA